MDIVKQRKKRLMAWLLAIGLCVGMWQGSVQATETVEETGTEDFIESVSDNAGVTETPSETDRNYYYYMEYADQIADDTFRREITYTKEDGSSAQAELIQMENGAYAIEIKDTSPVVSVTFKGVSEGSGEYEHSLLSWSAGNSGTYVAYGSGNTITAGEYGVSGWNWDSISKLDLFWEKILVVMNGDSITEYHESKNTSEGNKCETIRLPSVEAISDADIYDKESGMFFSRWLVQSREGIEVVEGNEYKFSYADAKNYFTEINLIKEYGDNTVPKGGSFALSEKSYSLSDSYSEWMVNDDGYTYSGGIEFYSPGQTYSFTAK